MSNQSIILLDSLPNQMNITGKPFKAAGYFGLTRGLHTVQLSVTDFIGRIFIEASLATKTCEDEWFPIFLTNMPYIEFPLNPAQPTGTLGDTVTLGFSFHINAVWIRARVDRSYIINPNITQVGLCNRILLSY